MARPLRFVYPGAVYHVMARGDGGKKLFLTDSDHLLFLDWLDGACKSHGWRIHAWVLMGNHFHISGVSSIRSNQELFSTFFTADFWA